MFFAIVDNQELQENITEGVGLHECLTEYLQKIVYGAGPSVTAIEDIIGNTITGGDFSRVS